MEFEVWLGVGVVLITIYIFLAYFTNKDLTGKVILITGCDTGFGNLTAKKLGSLKSIVFATCLNDTTAKKLDDETPSNVVVYKMDVTNLKSIEECKQKIINYLKINNLSSLDGIVNNAGIIDVFPIECTTIEQFNKVINVNLLGYSNIIHYFSPLLNKNLNNLSKKSSIVFLYKYLFGIIWNNYGRIVNIASIAGRVCTPFMASYSASKYGIIGYTASIRTELFKLFDVWVCTVEPSFTSTNLLNTVLNEKLNENKWKNFEEYNKNKNNNSIIKLYNKNKWLNINRFRDKIMKKIVTDNKPERVVNSIIRGLSSKYPLRCYYPNWQSKIIQLLVKFLPGTLVDIAIGVFSRIDITN